LFGVCAKRARTMGTRDHRTVPVDAIGPALDAATFSSSGSWTSPPSPWPEDAASVLTDAANLERIREALRGLPDLQRAVVTMRDVDGLPAPDVCRILSITASNQRVLLHRGHEQIRRDISKEIIR
jgi:RNA polymerase sigma-70 factor (ECF subfamily)